MPNNKEYDILVVGDYCVDFIFTGLPSLPVLGNEIVSKQFVQTPGGTCNSVIAMHRLGLNVGWMADFGNDTYSKFIIEKIAKEGIDQNLFVFHECPLRKITVSLSYSQDRAFIAYYDPDPFIPAGIKLLPWVRGKLLYVPGIYTGPGALTNLKILHSRGIKICMDGNSSEFHTLKEKKILKILSKLDLFMANTKELKQLTGISEPEHALQELGKITPIVVIKDGANGAYAIENGKIIHSPSINVEAVDTTGAGDSFNAGFIKAWITGHSINDCLQWGNIVGGLSTTEMGGIGRSILCAEVEKYLHKFYKRN